MAAAASDGGISYAACAVSAGAAPASNAPLAAPAPALYIAARAVTRASRATAAAAAAEAAAATAAARPLVAGAAQAAGGWWVAHAGSTAGSRERRRRISPDASQIRSATAVSYLDSMGTVGRQNTSIFPAQIAAIETV